MRLLHTQRLEFREFVGDGIPDYAILSHTWGEEEILFHDIVNFTPAVKEKAGFKKLRGFQVLAAAKGFEWCWIDTCNIDKSSSAELSEAINSMFQWYQDSYICYVYLEDFEFVGLKRSEIVDNPSFRSVRWFTRGWTLQELVAPRALEFYDKSWVLMGSKKNFATGLAEITGVQVNVLMGEDPSTCTVAQRLSWAAERKTTRREDMAYSLLGLFRINMPLLYGEGARAFRRLQEAIMKETEDYSLFVWEDHDAQVPESSTIPSFVSLLAASPASFSPFTVRKSDHWGYADLEPIRKGTLIMEYPWMDGIVSDDPEDIDEPPVLTSRGVRLSLPALSFDEGRTLIAFLWSLRRGSGELVCIALKQSPSLKTVYARQRNGIRFISLNDLRDGTKIFKRATFYVQCNHEELQIWQPNFRASTHPPNWSAAVFLITLKRKQVIQVPFNTYPCTPVVFELEIASLRYFLAFGVHSDLTSWSIGWFKNPRKDHMVRVLDLLSRNFETYEPIQSPDDHLKTRDLAPPWSPEWFRVSARPKDWFRQIKNDVRNFSLEEIRQKDRLYTVIASVDCNVVETFERSRMGEPMALDEG